MPSWPTPTGSRSASTSAPCPAAPSWSGCPTAPRWAAPCTSTRTGSWTRASARATVTLPPDWALQVPSDYVDVLANAVPEAVRVAGIDPGQVVGIGTDFTACTVLPVLADGTPLCELPGYADRPHAYVKLWKHHAAQAQADRINELAHGTGGVLDRPLRRPDLQRVGVRQGAPAAGGGPGALRPRGPLRRGGGLDRLAADRSLRPQRVHRRLQGDLPGRPLSRPRLPGGAEPGVRGLRRGQARRRDRPARRRGGRAHRRRRPP